MKKLVLIILILFISKAALTSNLELANQLYYTAQYKRAASEYLSYLQNEDIPEGDIEELIFRLGLSYFMYGDHTNAVQAWTVGKERNAAFFKGRTFRIPAASMLPTLIVGDLILIDNQYYEHKPIARGDVVVFIEPGDPNGRTFIKRVMGLPGERISIKDKALYIDGEKVFDKVATHLDEQLLNSKRDQMEELRIPAQNYFLLGDNRDYSFDSRFFGSVSKEMILGRAMIIYGSTPGKVNMEGAGLERTGMVIK